VPVSRTFPVVVTERLADLVAVLVLAAAGVVALRGDPRILVAGVVVTVLLMLMLSPFVLQNATFAWTKLLTAFFVLVAVAFYVRGLAQNDATRRTIAVGAMAAALLTHYSAGPYAVGLAIAQIVLLWSRRKERPMWRELVLQAGLTAALLATWFAWSLVHYGAHTTFFSNTTSTVDAGLSVGAAVAWVGASVRPAVVAGGKKVPRRQVAVPEVVEERAVHLSAAGSGNHVHKSPRAHSVLGGSERGIHAEFLDRLDGCL